MSPIWYQKQQCWWPATCLATNYLWLSHWTLGAVSRQFILELWHYMNEEDRGWANTLSLYRLSFKVQFTEQCHILHHKSKIDHNMFQAEFYLELSFTHSPQFPVPHCGGGCNGQSGIIWCQATMTDPMAKVASCHSNCLFSHPVASGFTQPWQLSWTGSHFRTSVIFSPFLQFQVPHNHGVAAPMATPLLYHSSSRGFIDNQESFWLICHMVHDKSSFQHIKSIIYNISIISNNVNR